MDVFHASSCRRTAQAAGTRVAVCMDIARDTSMSTETGSWPNPFSPLIRYSYLIRQLVARDMKSRFRRSSLGLLWLVVSPLLLLTGYTLVFGVLLKARWGGAGSSVEFALVLFSGLIFYNFFSEVIGRSPSLLYDNQPFVKRMVFPLEVLNWSLLLSAAINFFIGLLTWCVFYLVVHKSLPATLPLILLVFIPFAVFALGCSWLLSAYSVYHPDAEHVVPILLLLTMFISPLFFPVESLPEGFRSVLQFNPLSHVLEQARAVLIGGRAPDVTTIAAGTAIALLTAWLGHASFMGNRDGFADAL